MVGEAGPEMFVPGQSGHIIPNNQLTNNNQVVNIYTGASVGEIEAALARAGIKSNAQSRTM
jgi:hypothetical protein